MSRPKIGRIVTHIPPVRLFRPAGPEAKDIPAAEVTLTIEEAEALRLCDLEGMDQNEAASSLDISRGTLQRILTGARSKTADAIANAKTIRIQGGAYVQNPCRIRCSACGHLGQSGYAEGTDTPCPHCGATSWVCESSQDFCRKRCGRHHGHGHGHLAD
jgi:predicted DNA-binding protein (UPF0251 family)